VADSLEATSGLGVSAQPEPEYYREIQQLSTPFASIAAFVGLIMGLGAVLAGTNWHQHPLRRHESSYT